MIAKFYFCCWRFRFMLKNATWHKVFVGGFCTQAPPYKAISPCNIWCGFNLIPQIGLTSLLMDLDPSELWGPNPQRATALMECTWNPAIWTGPSYKHCPASEAIFPQPATPSIFWPLFWFPISLSWFHNRVEQYPGQMEGNWCVFLPTKTKSMWLML